MKLGEAFVDVTCAQRPVEAALKEEIRQFLERKALKVEYRGNGLLITNAVKILPEEKKPDYRVERPKTEEEIEHAKGSGNTK